MLKSYKKKGDDMFVDEVIIKVSAGNGGNGCTSFLHEKYVEFGGPDGGNGGRGGNVIFKTENGIKTLIDLKYSSHIKAESGVNGMGKNMTGAQGKDLIIRVPVGTTLIDEDTMLVICDLNKTNQEFVVCSGGRGGKGNAAFKTNKNKAPLTSENGAPGESRIIKCELKLLADVGLVGFPSVGKSSLISVISASKPKIADYHFTTLSPNLGVVKVNDSSFVVADLPGLIEGANKGIGLGDKFLKHASRTKVICHIIDMASVEGRNPIDDYKIIRNELKEYSEILYNKKEIVVANKKDLPNFTINLKNFKKVYPNVEIFEISTITKEGINQLLYKLLELVNSIKDEDIYNENQYESHVVYEFKNEKPYKIEKISDHIYEIKGKKIEEIFKMTKFNSEESELRFAKKLKYLGIDDELRKLGIEEGDTVKILDFEFAFEERMY